MIVALNTKNGTEHVCDSIINYKDFYIDKQKITVMLCEGFSSFHVLIGSNETYFVIESSHKKSVIDKFYTDFLFIMENSNRVNVLQKISDDSNSNEFSHWWKTTKEANLKNEKGVLVPCRGCGKLFEIMPDAYHVKRICSQTCNGRHVGWIAAFKRNMKKKSH